MKKSQTYKRWWSKCYQQTIKLLNSRSKKLAVAKIAVIYLIILVASWNRLDPDFGWHLVVGNYIREHWVPNYDLYSYTTRGVRWVDHEWGNNVMVSYLYQWGGYGLLVGVFSAIWTASICLFRKRIRLIILVIAVLATIPYIGVRTTVWGVLGVAILLELIERNSKRAFAIIPLLILVWANLHGSFVIGLAFLAYFGVMRRQLKYIYMFVICVAVTLINPYGPRVYEQIANILFDRSVHSQITEWRSFWLTQKTWPFIILWAVGFSLFSKNKIKNWLALAPLMLIASLSASRYLPVFVTVALRDIDHYSTLYSLPKKLDRPRKIIIGLFAVIAISVIVYLLSGVYRRHTIDAGYPKQAVAYLKQHGCRGNLYNDYDYGGYLIWKLPSVPLYIDGRMPTWRYPSGQSHMTRYFEIHDDPILQKEEFDRYNVQCAILTVGPFDKEISNNLMKRGWKNVAHGNGSALFVSPNH